MTFIPEKASESLPEGNVEADNVATNINSVSAGGSTSNNIQLGRNDIDPEDRIWTVGANSHYIFVVDC
jgi:hypothetical protein